MPNSEISIKAISSILLLATGYVVGEIETTKIAPLFMQISQLLAWWGGIVISLLGIYKFCKHEINK